MRISHRVTWPICGAFLCLMGCASPNYALKPVVRNAAQPIRMNGMDFVRATGNSANILVAADVFDFLKSRYVLAALVVSNTSDAAFEISSSSLEMVCNSRNVESTLVSLEPEALVMRFSKERSAVDSSRGWGTFFLALAAARHDPGDNTDVTKVYNTVETRTVNTRIRSREASEVIRGLDRALIRNQVVPPGGKAGGLVFFPFSKADSYRLRAKVGDENHEFRFQLRNY